ncbi:MAG: ATP-binding protein [Desulfuromonadaceae bacterium]|nr:ATP-binding protein [Desulfuromonadaceae bacterium]MDD2850149.1 ATP-binding protein [Desulfuromonadaceae bacterium]MDD4132260.1 ATP-binding protein [Desulfuromonadaceae bacterium]
MNIRVLLLALSIVGISLLHYLTPLHLHYLHDIFQRLYYLPIILAAIWFGLRGGLTCSLAVSVAYAPHILFQWGGELTLEMEKYLEIVLYNIVGAVTGLLAQRERERSIELQKTAEGLEQSYKKLQEQSEQLIEIEKNLRSAEKLSTLGEMAAVLAHEIRNPLGSIRGTAEILKDDYRPGDAKYEFIDIQIRETERLNRVVEDFLRMARPLPTETVRCRVQAELETVVMLVSNDARERGVTLVLDTPSTDVVVNGNGEKLRQAFLNIAINSLQATPAGGRLTISTVLSRVDEAAAMCEIKFCDTGKGIDRESLPRIFEPFYTTKPDGTGLGLAITRKIIEGHGGTLNVESLVGLGTTVLVRLPVLPTEENL